MLHASPSTGSARLLTVLGGLGIFIWPSLLNGQGLARQALSSFPADTQQLAYSNLAQLRSSPDYPRVRERLLNRQLRYFQDFVRWMGLDPDKDLDEVVLGWRGPAVGYRGFLGMATGRFQPDQIREHFTQGQLPSLPYAGLDLYASGSGHDPADLFFTFLDSSLAVFGRLPDLKAILDVRQGKANALDTNASFSGWEAELEGTAPQWGVLNGQAAANLAAPWFADAKGLTTDVSAFFGPVQAVLYRVEWDNGFVAHLAILCRNAEGASAMATLVNVLHNAQQQPGGDGGTSMGSLLQSLEAQQNGSRLELSVSGPVEALELVIR
jgi:hypothetical protein